MKSKRLIMMFSLAFLLAVTFSAVAHADQWDRATKLTFSAPVEVPGKTLPAGTYWFTLYDSPANRNIVQIWDADRMNLVTTILALPNYRMQPTSETVVRFAERPIGHPEAIHSWFYPGANYGIEFVYPKSTATLLAQATHRPVLAMPDASAAQPAPGIKNAPVTGIKPSGETVEVAEVVSVDEVSILPQTASPLPLYAAFGFVVLAIGSGLRLATKKAL